VSTRLAAVQLAEGKPQQAERIAREGLVTAERLHLGPVEAAAHLVLGRARAALGDAEGAEASIDIALQLSRKAGDSYGEARSLAALGSLCGVGQTGRERRRARRYLERGAGIFEELGAALDLAAARESLGGAESP
jgi:hypothetical protein